MIVVFEAAPPLPPSFAQMNAQKKENRHDYLQSVGQLITNKSFSLLLVSFGVNVGVFYAYSTLLNQELVNFPVSFKAT